MPRRMHVVALTLTAAIADAGSAQQGAARVRVHGVAYDSLRGAPLAAAVVTIVGGTGSTRTDALGRFQFDSISPGVHTFAAQHDLLDSLGFTGISARAVVTDGRDEVRIAVPSFATLWRVACGDARPPRDSGFIYGTVRDVVTQAPVPNA